MLDDIPVLIEVNSKICLDFNEAQIESTLIAVVISHLHVHAKRRYCNICHLSEYACLRGGTCRMNASCPKLV